MHPAGDGGHDELFGVREVWPPGTIIKGDFSIERKLGGGGFGTVYLAKHRFLGSTHVIKRLHDQYAADENYVRKFFNEGRAVRRLKGCPYIVEVEHMTRSEDGNLILVMEYVSGGDLAGLMKSRTVSVAEAMEFGRHIALGLEAAHKEGLIHRDIKPENVMMSQDYSGNPILKLIDFGISADHGNENQQTSMRGGSIGYAAPEQWMRAGKDLDGRTDLYGLGVTLYRLLAGRMPFDEQDIGAWIDRVRKGPPTAVASLRKDCPRGLSDLIQELLAEKPEGRPANASVVAARLQVLLLVPVAPPPPERAKTVRLQEQRKTKVLHQSVPEARNSRLWIGGGLALASAITAGVFFYPQKREPVPVPAGPKAGDVRTNPKDRLVYAYVPSGDFRMGCATTADGPCEADEKPAHDVRISKGFWMGQTEVTTEAYKRFASATGRQMPPEPEFGGKRLNAGWNGEQLPMTMVSWTDSKDYCEWAGLGLPTEAEWEYAARAGTSGAHYANVDDIAWYGNNSGDRVIDTADILAKDASNYGKRIMENGNRTRPVGQKKANAFRMYDTLGNVWEWTADWYKASYEGENLEVDPTGRPGGEYRVLRGGSWYDFPSNVRASNRVRYLPSDRYFYIGFRCRGEIPVP